MYNIKPFNGKESINLPTSIKEITPDVLASIVEDVKLAPYYAIVAQVMKTNIVSIAIASNSKREENVTIVPLLAKINSVNELGKDFNVGDKVIIDKSSLIRGTHLHIANTISANYVYDMFYEDEKLRDAIIKGKYNNGVDNSTKVSNSLQNTSKDVYLIEFKIVPIGDIKASVSMNNTVKTVFK